MLLNICHNIEHGLVLTRWHGELFKSAAALVTAPDGNGKFFSRCCQIRNRKPRVIQEICGRFFDAQQAAFKPITRPLALDEADDARQ